mmetsp:Transcript_43531/g.94844  ORF Transcript_43531/g.94844 Transcript_43531/m.94844 type:complete len:200 (+) Transcript_43531:1261-1860(+)
MKSRLPHPEKTSTSQNAHHNCLDQCSTTSYRTTLAPASGAWFLSPACPTGAHVPAHQHPSRGLRSQAASRRPKHRNGFSHNWSDSNILRRQKATDECCGQEPGCSLCLRARELGRHRCTGTWEGRRARPTGSRKRSQHRRTQVAKTPLFCNILQARPVQPRTCAEAQCGSTPERLLRKHTAIDPKRHRKEKATPWQSAN